MHLPSWVKSLGRSNKRQEATVIQNDPENENHNDNRAVERDSFIQRSLRKGKRKVRRSVSAFSFRDRPQQTQSSSNQSNTPPTEAHEAPEIPFASVHSMKEVPGIEINRVVPVNNNLSAEVVSDPVNPPEPSSSSPDGGIASRDPSVKTQGSSIPIEVQMRKKVEDIVAQAIQNSNSPVALEIPPGAQQSSPLPVTPNVEQIDQQAEQELASRGAGATTREPSITTEGHADRDTQEPIFHANQTSSAPIIAEAGMGYQQLSPDPASSQFLHALDQTIFIGAAFDQSPPYLTQELFDSIFHGKNLYSICDKPRGQSSEVQFTYSEPRFEHLDPALFQGRKSKPLFELGRQDAKDDHIRVVETDSRSNGDHSPTRAFSPFKKVAISSDSKKPSTTETSLGHNFVSQQEGAITADEDTIPKEQACIPKTEDNIPKNEAPGLFVETYRISPIVLDGAVVPLSSRVSSAHGPETMPPVTGDIEIQRETLNLELPEPANEDLKSSSSACEKSRIRFQDISSNVCNVHQSSANQSEPEPGLYCHRFSPSELKFTKAAGEQSLHAIYCSNESKSLDQTQLFSTHDERQILPTVNNQASGDFDVPSDDAGASEASQELCMNTSTRKGEVSWSQKVSDKINAEEHREELLCDNGDLFLRPLDSSYRLRDVKLNESSSVTKNRNVSESSSMSSLFAQESETEADHNADAKANEGNGCLQHSQLMPESKLFHASRSRSQHGNGRIRALRATCRSGIEDLMNFANDYPQTCPAVVRFANSTEAVLLDCFLRQRIKTNWFTRWVENQSKDNVDDFLGDQLLYDGHDVLRRMVDEYQYYGVDGGYEALLADYYDSGYEDSI